jgi:hypothetical protein
MFLFVIASRSAEAGRAFLSNGYRRLFTGLKAAEA